MTQKQSEKANCEIFANFISDNGLISRICKELLQLNNKESNNYKISKDLNRNFFRENIQMAKKHMKRYSTSLIIRKMQVKSIKYHPTPIRMAVKNQTN